MINLLLPCSKFPKSTAVHKRKDGGKKGDMGWRLRSCHFEGRGFYVPSRSTLSLLVQSRPDTRPFFFSMICRLPEGRNTTLATSTRHVVLHVFLYSRVRSPFYLLPRWMPLRDLSTRVSVLVSFCHFVNRVKSGQACKAMTSAYFEPWAACFASRARQAGHATPE